MNFANQFGGAMIFNLNHKNWLTVGWLPGLGLAIVISVIAFALRLWPLDALGHQIPYLTFYPAIMFAALLGGLVVGVSTSLISAIIIYFWQSSHHPFLHELASQEGMAVFIITGLLVSTISEAMIRSQARAKLVKQAMVYQRRQADNEKQFEGKLQSSERKFRALFEESPIAILLIESKTGQIMDANSCAQALLGYSMPLLSDKHILELVEAADQPMFEHYCQQIIHGELQHVNAEQCFVKQDATSFWVHLSLSRMMSETGQVEFVIASLTDITDQKRTQMKLTEHNELLTEVSAMAHIGGWGFDPETGEGSWTGETARIHEVDPEAPTSAEFGLRFFEGDARRQIESAVKAATEQGKPYDLELPMTTAKGRQKWVRTICHPRVIDGKVVKVRGAFQDITERKQLEKELQDRAQHFRAAIDSTSAGIVLVDGVGRIVDVNQGYIEASGYQRQELLNMSIVDLEVSEDKEAVRNHIQKILTEGHDRFETFHRRKSGEVWPIETEVTHMNDTEGLFFAYIMDISDRKQSELKIAHYVQQLESSMEGTLKVISNMVEQRDPYTAGHECRVGKIAAAIAEEMGWDEERCKSLELIGMVHDIGKISVPAEILTKPGRLTPLEYKMVQTHAEKGYQILKDVDFPIPIAQIIRQHHEHLDGSGYPQGLKGDAILPEARILTVADVIRINGFSSPLS